MTPASKAILYLLFGGPVVLIAVYLLLLGPVGWFVAAFLGLAVLATRANREDDGMGTSRRVNCADCGAPNPPDRGACRHCGEPLPAGAPNGTD